MKGSKPKNVPAHTAHTKFGMGDNYGTGIKAKLGRVREDTMGMIHVTPKKLKTPPTSVA
jgi:hypothetical protein